MYDTLAHEIDESVPFDSVVDTGLRNALDLATADGQRRVKLVRQGTFGRVQAADATPLVLVLNELVSNAAEHGYPLGSCEGTVRGEITVTAHREGSRLLVHVDDDGQGMDGQHAHGLGTRIVENLVRTELNGTFVRGTRPEGGTRATIEVVLR